MGSLVKLTSAGVSTNYVVLNFSAANHGNFSITEYKSTGNPPDTYEGVFARFQSPAGNAPASLSGKSADVTLNGTSFKLSLRCDFTQTSSDTNVDSGVGAYTYSTLDTNSAQLTLLFTAPPLVTNDNAMVSVKFVAANFGVFTNQIGGGITNIGAISLPAGNFAPASFVGKTLSATNSNGVIDAVLFNGDGTFTQNETGSNLPGLSSGTYSVISSSSIGVMVQLSFASPDALAGSVAYVELIFSNSVSGSSSSRTTIMPV